MFLNEPLTASCHVATMAAISGIEPVAAHGYAQQREPRDNKAPVEFGAAVTHKDMVREKVRVDPASLVEKERAAKRARGDDPRDQRIAQDRADYEAAQEQRKGRYLDIEA